MISYIRRRGPAAFTLIELLLVILVLTILYGISLTSIRAVSRHTHQTATAAELKSIETAWKQYYAHYQRWPTNAPDTTAEHPDGLVEELAEAMQGTGDDDADLMNPDKIVFMEFARLNDKGAPLNVWGESGRFADAPCLYYVAFDDDYDNWVEFPTDDLPVSETESDPKSTSEYLKKWRALRAFEKNGENYRIRRGVIVWTFNPEIKADSPDYLIGSWQE